MGWLKRECLGTPKRQNGKLAETSVQSPSSKPNPTTQKAKPLPKKKFSRAHYKTTTVNEEVAKNDEEEQVLMVQLIGADVSQVCDDQQREESHT